MVIVKPSKDTFYSTIFHEYLMRRGITNLIITGVTTEVCVQTTMRCANDRRYDCLLVRMAPTASFPNSRRPLFVQWSRKGASWGGLVHRTRFFSFLMVYEKSSASVGISKSGPIGWK